MPLGFAFPLGEGFAFVVVVTKLSGTRRGQYYRRLILLRFVGWLPPYCVPSDAFLTLGSRVGPKTAS